jgi:hypothetical protein
MPPHRSHNITQLMSMSFHAYSNQMISLIMFSLIFQSLCRSIRQPYRLLSSTLLFVSRLSALEIGNEPSTELISKVGYQAELITEVGHQAATSHSAPTSMHKYSASICKDSSFICVVQPQSAPADITSSSHSPIQHYSTRGYAPLSVRSR